MANATTKLSSATEAGGAGMAIARPRRPRSMRLTRDTNKIDGLTGRAQGRHRVAPGDRLDELTRSALAAVDWRDVACGWLLMAAIVVALLA